MGKLDAREARDQLDLDVVQVRIVIELVNGDDDEMASAKTLLTKMTARL